MRWVIGMQENTVRKNIDEHNVWSDVDSARLIYAGDKRLDTAWDASTPEHSFWEFLHLWGGACSAAVPGTMLHSWQYHLAIYPGGLPKAEALHPANLEDTIYIGVDITGLVSHEGNLLLPDASGELRWLCQRILAEFQAEGVSELAQAYTRTLLHLAERKLGRYIFSEDDVVGLVTQYMQAHMSQHMNLRILADVACLTETHLVHRFSTRLGVSPMRHLQKLRIEEAKRLLMTTTLATSEIAAQVSFEDPLYFSRVFKRVTGYSPRAFRDLRNSIINNSCSTT